MTDSDIISQALGRYEAANGFLPEFRAALIDMDGTLLDSMKWHTKAWHRMMTELGVECNRDEFYLYEGMTGANTIDSLFLRAFHRHATEQEKTELYQRKTRYFNELPRVDVIPGAEDMLRVLMSRGITRVLVTGSGQRSNLDRLDDDFPGAFPQELRITARDVSRGKPDPEPYLKAMQMAGVTPRQAMVIENAPLGVKAGAASGAFTVAVTTGPVPVEAMWEAGAHMVLPSMEEFARILLLLLDAVR